MEVGQQFPEFSLQDQDGNTVTLDSLKGSKTIIYFYPKDDTPGCTAEACDFRDRQATLGGVKVIGVSADSVASHKKFADKFGLNFPLLADTDKSLINAAGVWNERTLYGKLGFGIERMTFLLDDDGSILKIWRKVRAKGHADQVLEALK